MTDSSLEEVVFASTKFCRLMKSIRVQAIRSEFPVITVEKLTISIDWNYLLLCASALTTVRTERAYRAVLRIASTCLIGHEATENQKNAAVALLGRGGNHRAIELAERRGLVSKDAWNDLPAPIRADVIRRKLELTVPLSTGTDLEVNDFQRKLWSEAESNKRLSVSAPTSAGKSHIVREWFLEILRSCGSLTAAYIVPTRALVEEVSTEFRKSAPEGVGVFIVPWDPDLHAVERRVLVVTQERLHLIQQSEPDFSIDLIFVDEAQNLGYPERDILLKQTLDQAVSRNPETQIIFASPFSRNPALYVDSYVKEDGGSASFVAESATVNQNLLRVESVYRSPQSRSVKLIHDGHPIGIGTVELEYRANTVNKRLAYVAHSLGGDEGGNIVYVNGASDAETVAKNIYESLSTNTDQGDGDIENLQEYIRIAVHPKYTLADVLVRGVAFHYGNMPLVIRAEIERLFTLGKIRYLVCTSTLLEGVNLPCRNIFIRNPQKGRGNPISEADFWNLAGRAGRWGREFQGNIVCIDTDDDKIWPNLPTVRSRTELQLSVRSGMSNPTELLSFVRNNHAVQSNTGPSENLFSYLCARAISTAGINDLLRLIPDEGVRSEIDDTVTRAIDGAGFPSHLISRHAGISPTAMQRLLESFRDAPGGPSELVLPLPEEDDAKPRYQNALVMIGAVATTAFGQPRKKAKATDPDKRKWQLANLIVNWMNGMPLNRLIEQRVSSGSGKTLSTAIREVMADIEGIARFQAPKYLACYNDILKVFAEESGVRDLGATQDVTMLLELGVSRPSEVVLMSLGLSRTATISISEYITEDNWTSGECLEWLAAQNLEGLDLPMLVQREIDDLLTDPPR